MKEKRIKFSKMPFRLKLKFKKYIEEGVEEIRDIEYLKPIKQMSEQELSDWMSDWFAMLSKDIYGNLEHIWEIEKTFKSMPIAQQLESMKECDEYYALNNLKPDDLKLTIYIKD